MKFGTLEHLGVDPAKLVLLGVAAAAIAALVFRLLVGEVLGSSTGIVLVVVGVLVFYMVVTTPRRIQFANARSQAREAVLLSTAAAACLSVTGSRTRTMLALRSKDPEISDVLTDAKRRILLGHSASGAIRGASTRLSSYSAINALMSVSERESGAIEERGEESQGIVSSSQLSRETRLPIFMTACFFAPILLVMYSVLSHVTSPLGLAELVALEVIALDVAFSFCSSERGTNG